MRNRLPIQPAAHRGRLVGRAPPSAGPGLQGRAMPDRASSLTSAVRSCRWHLGLARAEGPEAGHEIVEQSRLIAVSSKLEMQGMHERNRCVAARAAGRNLEIPDIAGKHELALERQEADKISQPARFCCVRFRLHGFPDSSRRSVMQRRSQNNLAACQSICDFGPASSSTRVLCELSLGLVPSILSRRLQTHI